MAHPRVIIEQERDAPRGWTFRVRVAPPPGDQRAGDDLREVRLSWVDHEYWSHGQCPPSGVVAALVGLLLEHDALGTLGESFDAAAARRVLPILDDELPRRL